jgi:hypothetical protein
LGGISHELFVRLILVRNQCKLFEWKSCNNFLSSIRYLSTFQYAREGQHKGAVCEDATTLRFFSSAVAAAANATDYTDYEVGGRMIFTACELGVAKTVARRFLLMRVTVAFAGGAEAATLNDIVISMENHNFTQPSSQTSPNQILATRRHPFKIA